MGELDDEVRLASIGTSQSLAAQMASAPAATRPGCEACSWSDTGCIQCRPDVSVFDRMRADDDEEEGLVARANAALEALAHVMAAPDGPAAVQLALTMEEAVLQLRAVLQPRLWDWARHEAIRRCQGFMEAGVEANEAALRGLRSIIRDASAGEL